jgi:hypothetical protein
MSDLQEQQARRKHKSRDLVTRYLRYKRWQPIDVKDKYGVFDELFLISRLKEAKGLDRFELSKWLSIFYLLNS